MIAHGKDIKIFSGTSNRPLAEAICKEVGTELGNAEVGAFSDGENFVSIYETVRGSDVFVVQSTSSPVNDNLMELLIMIDALKRASAGRITAVMPYFGYARQAGGQPDHPRRRRPGPHHGSPRQPDSGLL
jgi:ribose-phosphate pyrophosphokinase